MSPLKFLVASPPPLYNEAAIIHHFSEGGKGGGGHAGRRHVIILLDSFDSKSPNGTHRVLVMDVVWPYTELLRGDFVFEEFTSQLLLGLGFINQRGVIHGGMLSRCTLLCPALLCVRLILERHMRPVARGTLGTSICKSKVLTLPGATCRT